MCKHVFTTLLLRKGTKLLWNNWKFTLQFYLVVVEIVKLSGKSKIAPLENDCNEVNGNDGQYTYQTVYPWS